MISVVLQLVSGIGCAVVPWFQVLLLLKLLSAIATGGTMVTSYVICKCVDYLCPHLNINISTKLKYIFP